MVETKKLNVAFIHPDLGIGGAERLVLDVAVALSQKNKDVIFVTNHCDKSHTFSELQDGTFPVRVIGDWLPRSICGLFQALCAYVRMLYLSLIYIFFLRKDDKPDIFFIDQIPMAVPLVKLTGSKVIYYCHHPDLLASPAGGLLKRLYRKPIDWIEFVGTSLADVILVNSEYTAAVFRKTFPKIQKDIKVLYPTISFSCQDMINNVKKVKPLHELVPEMCTTKPTDVVFLSINRFHPAKKMELAIEAMEALKGKVSTYDWSCVYLVITGGYDSQSSINESYFKKLTQLCTDKGLNEKVVFLKSPSDKLKVKLISRCDCLIYTPVKEHFGIVPLEAMAAGKPVIACNSGGPRETVEHNVTGYLCEPNAADMAEYMSKLLNKTESHLLGISGKKRMQQHFSYDVFSCTVNDIVDNTFYSNTRMVNKIPDDKSTELS